MNDNAADAAQLVTCPTCRARPGEECRSRKRFHTARGHAGLSTAMRDTHRRHERAWRARQRVAEAVAAGREPADTDIVGMLACVCGECGLDEILADIASIPAAVQ